MLRGFSRCLAAAALLLWSAAVLAPAARATSVSDDFEGDAVGSFPASGWGDVRAVALPNTPIPSASVIATTGPSGEPTQALQTVDAAAPSKGVFAPIAPAAGHALSGDVRVDRYGTPGADATPVSDWPLMLGVSEVIPGSDVCCYPTPQVGLYVSTLTEGFRLYAIDGAGNATDIDLGASALAGTWYRVELGIDPLDGSVHSRVVDASTQDVLLDRTDTLPGWTPAAFDAIDFFAGELSSAASPGLGSLDDVQYAATPEPGTGLLLALGLAGAAAARGSRRSG
jgi:hypothetical protein